MSPACPFPTRSQTRLPPPTPLTEAYVRVTLGDPASRTPFLHLTPALLRALPMLLSSPAALSLTLRPPPPCPASATEAHPAFLPYPGFWLDAPLADFTLSIEAAASSCVLGLAGVTARAFTHPGQRDAGTVTAAVVSTENSSVLTDLALAYLVIRPLPAPQQPPVLPALASGEVLRCSVVAAEPSLSSDGVLQVAGAESRPLEELLSPAAGAGVFALDLRLPRRLQNLNTYADAALEVAAVSGRVAVLIAGSPELCVLLALKQSALPVLCRVAAGSAADRGAVRPDPRVDGVAAAAAFAQSVGLRGLVFGASELQGDGAGRRRAAVRNCALAIVVELGEGEGDVEKAREDVNGERGLKVDEGTSECAFGRAAAALQVDGALSGEACIVVATCAVFGPSDFSGSASGSGNSKDEALHGEESPHAGSPASHGSIVSIESEAATTGAARGMGCRSRSVTFSDPVVMPEAAHRSTDGF